MLQHPASTLVNNAAIKARDSNTNKLVLRTLFRDKDRERKMNFS